jgi:hypothetical protein
MCKFVPLHSMMTYGGIGNIVTIILNFGCWWSWVISFMTSPFSLGNELSVPISGLGGLRSPSWSFGDAKNISPAGNRTLISRLSGPYLSHCTDYIRENLQSQQVTRSLPINSHTATPRGCRLFPSRFDHLWVNCPYSLEVCGLLVIVSGYQWRQSYVGNTQCW